VFDAVGLEVADAGPGHRLYAAPGQEEDSHYRYVADAPEGIGRDGFDQRGCL